MATATRPRSVELLADEEAAAWAEYLDATRDQPTARYEEVEPWAWSKLRARLTAIAASRSAVSEDDGA